MTRTDEHSPSNFDPAEYTYVGSFDAWRDYHLTPAAAEEERRLIAFLDHHGFEGGNWERKGQCDHCGARFRYVQVWEHLPTNVYVAIGETCGDERFGLDSRASFDRKALQGRAAAAREAAKKAASIAATYEANPGLAEAFEVPNDFISDVRSKLERYGSISERQIAAVIRVAASTRARLVERAAEDERKVPAPVGRVTFFGEVVSRKFFEGDWGCGYKLTVKVTAPEGIYLVNFNEPSKIRTERGDTVRVTATLTQSDRDPSFAFGKRPSGAAILDRPEVADDAPSSLA